MDAPCFFLDNGIVNMLYSVGLSPVRKPIHFIASSLRDLKRMPGPVQDVFGKQLLDAQYGDTPYGAKPLKGFAGAGVLELIEDHMTDTFRAVYTVNFPEAVYVLHVFQKKSHHGIATSKRDVDLMRARYRLAQQDHQQRYRHKMESRQHRSP